jgi:sulfite exporter TauE/SafE
MTELLNLVPFFLAGLLGGGHCLGMCGGFVTAFSFHLPKARRWRYLLGLNAGRLLGYMGIGMIMGWLGAGVLLTRLWSIQLILHSIASIILLFLGLYIAGFSSKITLLEKIGAPIWRCLQPILHYFLPMRYWWQTLPVGMLWGWLPCGMVYTAAISALASTSWQQGAFIMMAFGLGTLPNLLLMGRFAVEIQSYWRHRWVRLLSGTFISFFALLGIF